VAEAGTGELNPANQQTFMVLELLYQVRKEQMRLWLEQSLRMYQQIESGAQKDEVREFKIRLVQMLGEGEDDKETRDGM